MSHTDTTTDQAIRAAYDAWLQTSSRSDAAFKRVVERKVTTSAAATRLARETEEREQEFEALCYAAGLDPRDQARKLRAEDDALRAAILAQVLPSAAPTTIKRQPHIGLTGTVEASHSPFGTRYYLIEEAYGSDAIVRQCIDHAITHAQVTGSVGATWEITDVDRYVSGAKVTELIRRKVGS